MEDLSKILVKAKASLLELKINVPSLNVLLTLQLSCPKLVTLNPTGRLFK